MEATASGNVGPGSRGGTSRRQGEAADQALQPLATVTPVGIRLPTLAARLVYGVTATGPSAGLVARLAQWWEAVRERLGPSTTRGIHGEHGPEHQSRRTPWMPRMGQLVPPSRVTVRLASSPPSHRKSTPSDRGWGL
jgi:hypothetical protein